MQAELDFAFDVAPEHTARIVLGVLVVGLLLLTWAGIRLGLRSLQPLVDSLRAREGERIRDFCIADWQRVRRSALGA